MYTYMYMKYRCICNTVQFILINLVVIRILFVYDNDLYLTVLNNIWI